MSGFLRRRFIPLVCLLILIALAVYYVSQQHAPRDLRVAVPVAHFKLSNGLTVVVLPNDRIPAVTHMLVVKAGGADDPYGKTGLAHYLEHLMFIGSKNYTEGAYNQNIARVGGMQNAYTKKDYTLYYATVAREHLPMVMAMEADRFKEPLFDSAKVARELSVITEERNMRVENNAGAQLDEQLNALTFLNHPYHHPTIGWAEDMATLTLADAKEFFANYYRASNMVLVLAGDITVSQARRYAQRYYGDLPAGTKVVRNWPKEIPWRMERRAVMHDAKVREPQLTRQYIAPSLMEGDRAQVMPLAVLESYLGDGGSSYLYQKLVREMQLASAIGTSYNTVGLGPQTFSIDATPAPGVTLEQLEAGIDTALAQFMATPPDATAFARAKSRLKAGVIFAQDGLPALGDMIAGFYAIGSDEQFFYDWPDAIERVTATEMHEAAKVILAPKKRVTGYLLPEEVVPAAPPVEVKHAP